MPAAAQKKVAPARRRAVAEHLRLIQFLTCA